MEACGPPAPGHERVLRGEPAAYPSLESSLARETRSRPDDPAPRFWKRLHAATSALDFLRSHGLLDAVRGAGDHDRIELVDWILAEAIVQHYGYRSHYIDVTASLDVALWFASRRFTSHGELLQGVDGALRASLPAWYEPNPDPGYLLVVEAPRWTGAEALRPGHLVDLRPLAPPGESRIRRQHALALYAPFETDRPTGLADRVRARIRLELPSDELPAGRTADHLFPGPDTDGLYRHFLEAPFYRTRFPDDEGRTFAAVEVGGGEEAPGVLEYGEEEARPLERRSLLVPEYHGDRFDMDRLRAFRADDRSLEPTLYWRWLPGRADEIVFEAGADGGEVEGEERARLLQALSRAFPILLTRPRLVFSMRVGPPDEVRGRPLDVPPLLRGFALEYAPDAFTHPWEEERMLRGFWFRAVDPELLEIRFMGTRRGRPLITAPIRYRWGEEGWQVEGGPDAWVHFTFVANLVRWLRNDTLRLTDPGRSSNGYAEVQGGERFGELLERIRWL